jgi:hypothetical protein
MRQLLPLLLLPWFIAPAMAQAPANSWRVVNHTGQEATRLVTLEPGTTPARTRNRLREPVADGAEKRFRRKAGTPCRFDLRMRLTDGQEAVLPGHDICAQPRAVFERASVQAAARAAPPGRTPRQPAR